MSPGCLHGDTPSAGALGSAEHVSNPKLDCRVNSTRCSQQLRCSAGTVILSWSRLCLCLGRSIPFMAQFAHCCISLRADVMFYVSFYSGNFRVTGVLTNLEPFFVRPDGVSAVSAMQENPVAFSHCCSWQNTREHSDSRALVIVLKHKS